MSTGIEKQRRIKLRAFNPARPKWNFSFSPVVVQFETDSKTILELIEADELEIVGKFSKQLGVAEDFKLKGDGRKLTEAEAFIGNLGSVFRRLKFVAGGLPFTEENALALLNLSGSVQNVIARAAFEAYMEGRKEVAEWLITGWKSGKIKTSVQAKRELTQFEKSLSLPIVEQNRLTVANHLKKKFPSIPIDHKFLYKLETKAKIEGRKFLKKKLGNRIQAQNQIKEVFKKPKHTKKRVYSGNDYA